MAGNKNSQYDQGLIVKEVHDFHGQYLRTGDAKSVVPSYFSHFRASYDGQDRPTLVTYYRGSLEHITQIGTLPAASLGGKYFLIRNNPANSLFAVWYNLDGTSTAPVVSGATLVEVPVMTGDSAALVAMATELVINSAQSANFKATRLGQTVTITTTGMGLVTNSVDVDTGFLITNRAGQQEEVASISISYQGADPIYQGQVLKDYYYDIYSGKFQKDPSVTIQNVEIGGTVDVNVLNPSLNVNTGLQQGLTNAELRAAPVQTTVANQITGFATEANQNTANASLSSIDAKTPVLLGGKVPVDTGLSQPLTNSELRAAPVSTTITNQISGFATEATLLDVGNLIQDARNIKEKILAAPDREQVITYADFGTKNQRITAIAYSSALYSGTTLVKTINYTLVGNSYRRDSIEWSTV